MKIDGKFRVMGLLAFLVIALLILTGCQFLTKKAVEKGTGVKVESEEETGKEVDTSDIPDELIYPDSKAEDRVKITLPQGEAVTVTFTTSDDIDDVEAHYDEEPTSAGWTQQAKLEQENVLYTFVKDKSYATVSIEKESGKTKILLQYVKEMK